MCLREVNCWMPKYFEYSYYMSHLKCIRIDFTSELSREGLLLSDSDVVKVYLWKCFVRIFRVNIHIADVSPIFFILVFFFLVKLKLHPIPFIALPTEIRPLNIAF